MIDQIEQLARQLRTWRMERELELPLSSSFLDDELDEPLTYDHAEQRLKKMRESARLHRNRVRGFIAVLIGWATSGLMLAFGTLANGWANTGGYGYGSYLCFSGLVIGLLSLTGTLVAWLAS